MCRLKTSSATRRKLNKYQFKTYFSYTFLFINNCFLT